MSPCGVAGVDCVISELSHMSLCSVTGVDCVINGMSQTHGVLIRTRHCVVSQDLVVSPIDCRICHHVVSHTSQCGVISGMSQCSDAHITVSLSQELIVSLVSYHNVMSHMSVCCHLS